MDDKIKTHGSESRGQEEAACTHVFWPTRPLQWVIYTDGSTQILSRLTVVSREAKKKQHAHASSGLRNHYSELFTRMAALKF